MSRQVIAATHERISARRLSGGEARRATWLALVCLLALVAALVTPGSARADDAPAVTVAVQPVTLRHPQAAHGYHPTLDVALTGIAKGDSLSLRLTTPNNPDRWLGEVTLKAGQTRWTGPTPTAIERAAAPTGGSWTIIAQVYRPVDATTGTSVATGKRSGTFAAALTPKVTVKAATLTKNRDVCSQVGWKVTVANLDGSGSPDLTVTLAHGSAKYYGNVHDVTNGTHTVQVPTCSGDPKVGTYKGTAKLVLDGGPTVSASAKVIIRTNPRLGFGIVEGSKEKSGKRVISGWASPLGDTGGLPVKIYYKATGAKSYKYIATVKLKDGHLEYKTSKIYTGHIYLKMAASKYTGAAKSKVYAITKSKLR